MYEGVQSFNSAIHNFGKSGDFRNVSYLHAGISERLRCSACRKNICAKFFQCLGKFNYACFIRDAD